MFRKFVEWLVDRAVRTPLIVVFVALAVFAGLGSLAWQIQHNVRTDFLELLPRDSARFIAFEGQIARVGGGAKMFVVVTSPDRKKNEKFIDDLTVKLNAYADEKNTCKKTCAAADEACNKRCFNPISYMETGTKDVRAFYDANKWLFADVADIEKADDQLDQQIAFQGLVEDLSTDDPKPSPVAPTTTAGRPKPNRAPGGSHADGGAGAVGSTDAGTDAATDGGKKPALGVKEYLDRWDQKANNKDTFPTGYFATEDGTALGLKIVSNTTLGDARGDGLVGDVNRIIEGMSVTANYHPDMQVGLAGDIASANDEKRAIVSDAVWAFVIAFGIIIAALIFYYRSFFSPVVVLVPALFGVVAAYAFAYVTFGYINTVGAFLGAIVLGNGINYPIVLLSRYQEFRARGMDPREAKKEAVFNAFRAEFVGAAVASIAYGSLVTTRFRGFSQFGTIGFVGMLVVWLCIIPLVPALLELKERALKTLGVPQWAEPPKLRADGSRSLLTKSLADLTTRFPWPFVLAGVAVTVVAATQIPHYIKDPWEYDFGRLGSRSTHISGANKWSDKANQVFGGKMNVTGALMLADTPEQVPALKKQILANDQKDPEGPLLSDIASISDLLPGTTKEQERKLELLTSIREKLTPRVVQSLPENEQKDVERFRPPETLRTVSVKDIPQILQRPFSEKNGTVGTVIYIRPKSISMSDAHNHLRLSKTCDNVRLPDGTLVKTATSSTVFAEMIDNIRHDGPLASLVSLAGVALVVIFATRNWRGALAVLTALLIGVTWLGGAAAYWNIRINYVNFIAFPITFGIGCEYPFNISDRARLLGWNVREGVMRSAGAVMLCSFTTIVGYGSGMYSDVQAMESFGKLAVIGEVACIFAAVLFMPSLLILLQRTQKKPAAQ